MTIRLAKFLALVRTSHWVSVPAAWTGTAAKAFAQGLVTRGWGGVITVTRKGGSK